MYERKILLNNFKHKSTPEKQNEVARGQTEGVLFGRTEGLN